MSLHRFSSFKYTYPIKASNAVESCRIGNEFFLLALLFDTALRPLRTTDFSYDVKGKIWGEFSKRCNSLDCVSALFDVVMNG